MDKRPLMKMVIEPAENGGHTVEHHFKSTPHKGRPHSLAMEYHEPERHVFGEDEHQKMMGHIAKHLGVKDEPETKAKAKADGAEEDDEEED